MARCSTCNRSTLRVNTASVPPTPRKVYSVSSSSGTMPIGATARAARIVVAEPVSTSTSSMSTRAPRYDTVTRAKASSSLRVSCIVPPNADPTPLANVQILAARVHKIEFARRIFVVQPLVRVHRRRPVRAGLDHGDAIEQPAVILGVRLDGLNDQPLIGIRFTHFGPNHKNLPESANCNVCSTSIVQMLRLDRRR